MRVSITRSHAAPRGAGARRASRNRTPCGRPRRSVARSRSERRHQAPYPRECFARSRHRARESAAAAQRWLGGRKPHIFIPEPVLAAQRRALGRVTWANACVCVDHWLIFARLRVTPGAAARPLRRHTPGADPCSRYAAPLIPTQTGVWRPPMPPPALQNRPGRPFPADAPFSPRRPPAEPQGAPGGHTEPRGKAFARRPL